MKKQSLVLLHGWSFNPKYFNILDNLLEKHYEVFKPIMPGFGSISISSPYNLDAYSDWLNKYIQKNNITNPVLIGHSFGGSVCLYYLNKYPNKKIKLILVNAAIIRSKYSLKRKTLHFLIHITTPILDYLKIKTYLLKVAGLSNSDYQNISNPIMKQTFNQIIFSDLSHIAQQIPNRTLIIWGENDKTTPLIQGKQINRLIKSSSLKIISDAGHFPFIDDPIEFVSYLNNFIQKK